MMNNTVNDEQLKKAQGYSTSHMSKGLDYEARFFSLPGRRFMWQQEKMLLSDIMQIVSIRHRAYLDFAAGTGRILAHLGPYFKTKYAIDISSQMLSIAKEKHPAAQFVNADFRDDPALLHPLMFDLVTAFRFFPNAEEELQYSAINYIVQHLETNGYLIINNHRTHDSITYRILRKLRGTCDKVGMRHSEVMRLASGQPLRLVKSYSLGIMPQTEYRAVLPWRLIRILEKANFYFGADKHYLGYNTIYLFQKSS
jgi:SAM-dependent methyltransferase